ncbi:hypothetical protein ABZ611_13590 [Streptomyces sp. NPDC007861]|uniref:hypothetical protein n=1 Tax=Streptomyces sp. NPDC007861 TaxID=3154893 RepID=UPI0033DD7A3A
MTGVIITFFVLTAFFVVLGCVDQRRLYWRFTAWRYRNPEANEPSDAAYNRGRILAFVIAGAMLFSACGAMNFADDSSWSSGELGDVVEAAAESIEAETHSTSGGASTVEEALRDAAEGEGPYYKLHVETAGSDRYLVSTDTGEYPFCLSMTSSESGGFAVPGADGSTTVVPEYALAVSVDEGRC